MAAVTIVADTGPLIALAKIEKLDLLRTLFGQVAIPSTVMQESLARQSPEAKHIRQAMKQYITVTSPTTPAPEVKLATLDLDLGEAEAVALAAEHECPLLIDEVAGRMAASQLGIHVIGTVGVLLHAKLTRNIALVMPALLEMQHQGYWFSESLLQQARKLASE